MSVPSIHRRTYYISPILSVTELGPCKFAQRRDVRDALLPSYASIRVTGYASLVDNAIITVPMYGGVDVILEMHVTAGYAHVAGQFEVDLTAAATDEAAASEIADALVAALGTLAVPVQETGSTIVLLNDKVSILSWDQAGRVGRPITGTAAGVAYQQAEPGAHPRPFPFPLTSPVYPFIARSGYRRQFRQVFPRVLTP